MVGETITANVDVLSHNRMHTIGNAPPPSKHPRILINQFRDIPTKWKIHEIAASKVPYVANPKTDTQNRERVLALGLIYALYILKVISEEAAMLSAEVEEVVAMKSKTTMSPAPAFPISAIAAAGPTRPAETCAALSLTGRTDVPVSAAAVRLNVVDMAKGMAYHAKDPRTYPFTAVAG